jgi:hypothetical protein
MRSQILAAVMEILLTVACETANVSHTSAPVDAPDLSLESVAFARLTEGRVVARGTAEHLDYRRAGGRLVAYVGAASMEPEPGTGLASFGTLYFAAPHVDGEIANRRGTAWGGVNLDTGRGDRAFTDAVDYDGTVVRSDKKVTARGPGYRVQGNGLVAQADGSAVRLIDGVTGQLQMEASR